MLIGTINRFIVDGGWSSWGPWSGCSSNCGEGKNYRGRQCDNPLPQNWGRSCEGPSLEEGACFDDTCVNTGEFVQLSVARINDFNLFDLLSTTILGQVLKVGTLRCLLKR